MGIDIYLRWQGQSEAEETAQITGFDTTMGHVGYLREAYHGEPYATRVLLPETWAGDEGGTAIPAATLKERLPMTLETVAVREKRIYRSSEEEIAKVQRSFIDFVALVERLEEAGRHPRIINSY